MTYPPGASVSVFPGLQGLSISSVLCHYDPPVCGHQVPRLEKRCYFNKLILDPGRCCAPLSFLPPPQRMELHGTLLAQQRVSRSDGPRGLGCTHVTCVVHTYMVYVYVILCTLILWFVCVMCALRSMEHIYNIACCVQTCRHGAYACDVLALTGEMYTCNVSSCICLCIVCSTVSVVL